MINAWVWPRAFRKAFLARSGNQLGLINIITAKNTCPPICSEKGNVLCSTNTSLSYYLFSMNLIPVNGPPAKVQVMTWLVLMTPPSNSMILLPGLKFLQLRNRSSKYPKIGCFDEIENLLVLTKLSESTKNIVFFQKSENSMCLMSWKDLSHSLERKTQICKT